MLYFLFVIWQLAAAEHAVLVQAGELNATGVLILPKGILAVNATWCNPVQPQSVSFSIFALAFLNPFNKAGIEQALQAEYCNQPIPSWALVTGSGGLGGYNLSRYAVNRT
jgi:hypothetical protein